MATATIGNEDSHEYIGTIQYRHVVAVVLRQGISPLRCFVGEVMKVDKRGFRMTLIDWLIMSFCGYDIFIPWANIDFAFVCTPEHDLDQFINMAQGWQEQYTNQSYT